MERETFRYEVEKELRNMNRKQFVFFAWLCGLRTLPFIGAKGSFNYLEGENWKGYLYVLFRALDVASSYIFNVDYDDFFTTATTTRSVANIAHATHAAFVASASYYTHFDDACAAYATADAITAISIADAADLDAETAHINCADHAANDARTTARICFRCAEHTISYSAFGAYAYAIRTVAYACDAVADSYASIRDAAHAKALANFAHAANCAYACGTAYHGHYGDDIIAAANSADESSSYYLRTANDAANAYIKDASAVADIAANIAAYSFINHKINLQNVIFMDIKAIKSRLFTFDNDSSWYGTWYSNTVQIAPSAEMEVMKNRHFTFDNNLSQYGELWNNFQQTLVKEGCSYWGKLYQRIFEQVFILKKSDIEALKIRMNVPVEIQDEGVVAVALYLEKLKKKENVL